MSERERIEAAVEAALADADAECESCGRALLAEHAHLVEWPGAIFDTALLCPICAEDEELIG